MGQMMRVMVRGWLVYELTDSPLWLGLVTTAMAIPMLLVPFFGGILADRVDRRNILIYSQMVLMALWFLMGGLIATGLIEVWHIFVIALISGSIQSVSLPAQQAIIPSLVGRDDLMNAISLNSAAQSTARIVGPFLGGMLVGVIGIDGAFYLTAMMLIPVVIMLFMMDWRSHATEMKRQSMGRDLMEVLKFIIGNPAVCGLMGLTASASLFAVPYSMLLPVFARDILAVGATGLGALMAASGAGSLVGALSIASLGNYQRKGLLLIGCAFTFGGLLVIFSQSPWFPLSLVLLVGLGAAATGSYTLNNTLLQLLAPDRLRGRMMGIQLIGFGLSPLGSLLIGGLAEQMGTALAIGLGAGVHLALMLALVAAIPQLRSLS